MKRLLFVMSVALVLSGCATSKEELLPAGEQTMLELWQGKTAGGGQRHAL
ncbi:TIGR03751 family conjugal transfer lipoprotein, partial [Escherichia coli]|nr:TIGR03751 family conjugal transfer lipoprotein [Escherichia coli]